MRTYYVYIMASTAGRTATLYTGVTNDLARRVWEHRQRLPGTFVGRYGVTRLVWCADFSRIDDAIGAEKRIRGWTRAKKIALIEEENPNWEDLSAGWFD